MSKKVQLPTITISQELYEEIILSNKVEYVDDIVEYRYGYDNKRVCYCVPDKYITVRGIVLNNLCYWSKNIKTDNDFVDWKLYICQLNREQKEDYTPSFAPHYCKYLVHEQLHKNGLNDDDIDNRLHQFEAEYSEELKQQHLLTIPDRDIIYQFNDCVYYDINKAHSDALSEIFPEIKEWLKDIAKKAKTDKRWKQVPNLYVGILNHRKKSQEVAEYSKTYNWVVQRTTKTLLKMIDKLEGFRTIKVYVNTDGFVLSKPKMKVESSDKFGEFKLETNETTFYTYSDKNYSIIQYGDTIKGNLPVALRDNVDLRIGKIVTFDKVKNDKGIFEYRNIETKYKDIEVI